MGLSTFIEIRALFGLIACVTLVTLLTPGVGNHLFQRLEHRVAKLANRRTACWVAVAVAVVVIRLALIPGWRIPRPQIHDEFAYLFGAATFADGRLTNPTPKHREFFEAPHILTAPSFQSKYPPGQSMILAAGTLLGNPWFGVLLSCALMSGAICWMLQGWMPARWALLGGLLSMVRLAIYSYWMNSYWGGALAAIGGCLVVGAYPRIVRRGRFGHAWMMGLGLLILANTRPLEGALTSAPIGVAMVFWLCRQQSTALRRSAISVAMPLLLCLAAVIAFAGYYNFRVTGSAVRFPHVEYAWQYQHGPMLIFGKLDHRQIVYANSDMGYDQAIWEPVAVREVQEHYLSRRAYYVNVADHETLGLLLALPLLMIPFTFRDKRIRLMFVGLLVMLLLMLVECSASLHYAGPQIGAFFGLLVQCIRHLRAAPRGRRRVAGWFLSWALPAASVLCFTGFGISRAMQTGQGGSLTPIQHRPEIESQLAADSHGKAIVFTSYRFDPQVISPFEDWNYNSPDLQNAAVLWVHDMGAAKNKELLHEYADRVPWYCTIDCTSTTPKTPLITAQPPAGELP